MLPSAPSDRYWGQVIGPVKTSVRGSRGSSPAADTVGSVRGEREKRRRETTEPARRPRRLTAPTHRGDRPGRPSGGRRGRPAEPTRDGGQGWGGSGKGFGGSPGRAHSGVWISVSRAEILMRQAPVYPPGAYSMSTCHRCSAGESQVKDPRCTLAALGGQTRRTRCRVSGAHDAEYAVGDEEDAHQQRDDGEDCGTRMHHAISSEERCASASPGRRA